MSLVSGLLNQTIDVYSVSKNSYNDTVRTLKYADVQCRFVDTNTSSISREADMKEVRADLWLEADLDISNTDEFYKDNEWYQIGRYIYHRGLDGNTDHIRIVLV